MLVVGDATSRILKLWSVDIESKPQCTYTLTLTSSKGGPSSFFNHLIVQPAFGAVLLANTAGKQVYVLHAKQDDDGNARFDYLSDFAVTQVSDRGGGRREGRNPGSVNSPLGVVQCLS